MSYWQVINLKRSSRRSVLNPASFPHIWEAIIIESEAGALLALGQTCRALRETIKAFLWHASLVLREQCPAHALASGVLHHKRSSKPRVAKKACLVTYRLHIKGLGELVRHIGALRELAHVRVLDTSPAFVPTLFVSGCDFSGIEVMRYWYDTNFGWSVAPVVRAPRAVVFISADKEGERTGPS